MNIQQFMPRELRSYQNIAAGRRLALARKAFGFDDKGAQTRFATEAGLKPNHYNQWEKGERCPPPGYLTKLCIKYVGLTTDWVYLGKMDGMPHWLTKRLFELLDGATELLYQPPSSSAAPPHLVAPLPKAKIVKVPKPPKRRRA